MSKAKRPGFRYETCRECGRDWNVSRLTVIRLGSYVCPQCWSQQRNNKDKRSNK